MFYCRACRIPPWSFLAFLALIVFTRLAEAQYYDGRLRTLPQEQGWVYGGFGALTATATNDAVLLDTSAANSTQAGWSFISPTDWDRTNGFRLGLQVRVNAETHASVHRAGFSLIILGADARGIELGFWAGKVFAQGDSPLFTHAEETALDTTAGFLSYRLSLLPTNYVLSLNDTPILSGPIRDYSAFEGFPNPYRTPNFLFLGDNTTSASASVEIRRVVLLQPPTLAVSDPGVLAWTGVRNESYLVEASTNLTVWIPVGLAVSDTDSFRFTNHVSGPARFFRVVVP